MTRSRVRVRVAMIIAVLLAGASTAAAGPLAWGGEFAIQADRSTNNWTSSDSRRLFPFSGSVAARVHWDGPAGMRLAAGAGYEQWVRTQQISIYDFTGGIFNSFEALGQVRERSFVVPLEIELRDGRGWTITPGFQWRHVFDGATRVKMMRADFSGQVVEITNRSWDPYDPPVRDRWSATFGFGHTWNGEAGTRSLGLRWVHGLTDVQSDPGVEEWHRSLQLVFGWSR